MTASVRLDFTNYDVWPPAVEFIDPLTGEYAPPFVQALVESGEGAHNLVVDSHPETNRPFFCIPGIRQYHDHPQHSGDSWLLHRVAGEGTLATICDRIWRAMARNVLGIHLELGTLPGQMQLQLRVTTAPGEVVAGLWEQAQQQEQAARAAQAGIALPGQGRSDAAAALGLVVAADAPRRPDGQGA
jgi:Predicted metal binding domain